MKRIILFLFCFLFTFSSIGHAEPSLITTAAGQVYENKFNHIRMIFPINWCIFENTVNGFDQLTAYSRNHPSATILVSIGPHQVKEHAAPFLTKNISSLRDEKIEDQGETIISGQKAQWILISGTDLGSKTYGLIYSIPTEKHDYIIVMSGNYNDCEEDRIIYDEFIRTLTIQP